MVVYIVCFSCQSLQELILTENLLPVSSSSYVCQCSRGLYSRWQVLECKISHFLIDMDWNPSCLMYAWALTGTPLQYVIVDRLGVFFY